MKTGKDLLQNVKRILEKELTIMVIPLEEFHVRRYVRKMKGVDIEVVRLRPSERAETSLPEKNSPLMLEKPSSRRELAHALKEILGWN